MRSGRTDLEQNSLIRNDEAVYFTATRKMLNRQRDICESRVESCQEVSVMATRQIVLDIPEKVLLAEKTDELAFAREVRMLAAVKLYELGRLSSGRAAGLAGMSRVEFLLSLGRYNVFPLPEELNDLEQDYASGDQ
jgi:predicted HTH domain antitoxin